METQTMTTTKSVKQEAWESYLKEAQAIAELEDKGLITPEERARKVNELRAKYDLAPIK